MKDKKVTWSKGALFCSGFIFVSVIVFVFWLYISGEIQNAYDVSLLITVVTVSGSIFGSNLVWYSKKACSENQYKLRIHMYEESARVRLNYNESMIKLTKQYDISREELDMIDSDGDMDDMMNSALINVTSGLDEAQSESDSANSIENF